VFSWVLIPSPVAPLVLVPCFLPPFVCRTMVVGHCVCCHLTSVAGRPTLPPTPTHTWAPTWARAAGYRPPPFASFLHGAPPSSLSLVVRSVIEDNGCLKEYDMRLKKSRKVSHYVWSCVAAFLCDLSHNTVLANRIVPHHLNSRFNKDVLSLAF
jgi:hypothetical protein